MPAAGGYLVDNPNVPGVTLDSARDVPCLVLLGAPGMGKSREAEAEVQKLRVLGLAADLVPVGRRADPLQTLLSLLEQPNGESWKADGRPWHLFIDGIDEAFGAAVGFEAPLRAFLKALSSSGGDLAKLRLRILCRTVEWTATLDYLVSDYWADNEVLKLQIAPLSLEDISRAVDEITGDVGAARRFQDRIRSIKAEALASRPVSLVMLAELQRDHGDLPAAQADLYRRGLEALVSEPNETRRKRARRGALTPAETLAVAGRIAAVAAFSGKPRIWVGVGSPPEPAAAFGLAEIAGGVEPAVPESFRVTEADLLDAVRTPLFVPLAADTYGWAHQTFMEYLAARYLFDHQLSTTDIHRFLTVADPSGARGIAPQWREIAAWVATFSKPVFDLLMAEEPDVLLQSDVAASSDNDRARLTSALLNRLDAGELGEIYQGLVALFGRLNHPGLADQIRDFVMDQAKTPFARQAAIDIAEQCNLTELGDDFATLALNGEESLRLRKDAAYAVYRLGPDAAKARLAPILNEGLEDDQLDELRGAVLSALWPDHIDLSQMLKALTPEKQRNFIGGYHMFLSRLELGELTAAQALEATAWLHGQLDDRNYDGLARARARVFWAAVMRTDDPNVRRAVAALIVDRFDALTNWTSKTHGDSQPTWPADVATRIATYREILEQAEKPASLGRLLIPRWGELLRKEDLEAVLRALLAEHVPRIQAAFAETVATLAHLSDLDDLVDVFTAAETVPALEDALRRIFFVPFESSAAEWMRENERRERNLEAKVTERAKAADEADQRVLEFLDAIDAGNVDMWWRLNLQLFVTPAGHYDAQHEFSSDLTTTPGWERSSAHTRRRIVDGAVRYLVEGRLTTRRWLGTNTQHRPASAAYRAMRLLRSERREAFDSLPERVWEEWSAVIVGFFDNDYGTGENAQAAILSTAYSHSPQRILRAVARVSLGPKSNGLSHRTLNLLREIYDTRIGELLDRLRRRPTFKSQDIEGGVWGFLLRMELPSAKLELRDVLGDDDGAASPASPSQEAIAVAVTERLAVGDLAVWKSAHDLAARRPELAHAIWSRYARGALWHDETIAPQVPADLLADVYLDLERLFPDRPKEGEGRFLASIDYIQNLQNGLLNRLVNGGTAESVAALERLQPALPQTEWLRLRLREARRNFRAAMRRLQAPSDVVATIARLSPALPVRNEIDSALAALALDARPATGDAQVPDQPDAPKPGVEPEGGEPNLGRRLKLLALATEWRSGHGGVSTINRDLCIAMAEMGHDVVCVALEASTEDQIAAAEHKVRLIRCPARPGIEGKARFQSLRSRDIDGFAPHFVFGHDHVNGAEGLEVSGELGARYVHMLHTVPQESEVFKDRVGEAHRNPERAHEKARAQIVVAREAQLVIGVGPKIADHAAQRLPGGPTVHELIPGLDPDLLSYTPDLGRLSRIFKCLMTARMPDAAVKGVRLACDAVKRAGTGREGTERPKLVLRGFTRGKMDDEFSKIGVFDDYVAFVERRPYTDDLEEIREDLQTCSLVLMPSLSEGFGLSALEAIAAGVPVVLTFESGLATLLLKAVQNGQIDSEVRDGCIARVLDDDEGVNLNEWTNKVTAAVSNPKEAFERAERLRKALRPLLTWKRAAESLTSDLFAVLDKTPE